MMNLQKLQGMGFKEANIAPYGNCVVVPGDKFDSDWEVDLGDQGHKCFEAFLMNKPVMLVQIEKKVTDPEEKLVYSPSAKPPEPKKERGWKLRELHHEDAWTPEEDAYLTELYDQGDLTYAAIGEKIHGRFPRRGPGSVGNHIFRLQKEGKLKPKKVRKGKKHKRDIEDAKVPQDPENNVEKVRKKKQALKTEAIPTSIPTEIPTSIPTKDAVVTLLEEIRDLLTPKKYHFDFFCGICREHGHVRDAENLWQFCPACGKPLIIWNVEA